MDKINSVLGLADEVWAVGLVALICAAGIALGKIQIRGISLGVTFVFFVGIFAGHLGLGMNPVILQYAMNLGLVLFVYTLGLQVGPGFVSAFRRGGMLLNLIALGVVLLGTLMAIGFHLVTDVSLADMVGVLCGATTNTPALGTAQQALEQIGQSEGCATLSLGCAVTYPLGVVGVILAYAVLRFLYLRMRHHHSALAQEDEEPFIVSFHVRNPAIVGKTLHEVTEITRNEFVVSRLWRRDEVMLPDSRTRLETDDRILIITHRGDVERLTMFFGERDATDWNKSDIDWNGLDPQLISRRIVITRHQINGRKLGALHLRNRFSVNVSRVNRAGIDLVATPDLVLRMGDRLTVVGESSAVEQVAKRMGNVVADLDEPNLVAIFVGIVVGLLLGAIPWNLPGISIPVRIGLAGGPIIVGILVGAYGPRMHMLTYTTSSANRMLRALGLSIYLACLGLQAGPRFFDTVIQADGALWVGLGFLITLLPVLVIGLLALRFSRLDVATVGGLLCGSMANPMALSYVNDSSGSDSASVAYTTVYPLSMIARIIIVQFVIIWFA